MKINLQYKITFLFTLITALTLSVGYVYLNKNLREYTGLNIKTELVKKTTLVKYSLEKMKTPQITLDQVDSIADQLGEDLQLRVTIISLEGTVLGDSELDGPSLLEVENHLMRPEVQQAKKFGFGESTRLSTTVNKKMLYHAMRFEHDHISGYIRLSLPLSDIELISAHLRGIIALSLFGVFILAIVINFFASAFISKPIQKMAKRAKQIAKGDFSKTYIFSLNDEIGDLANAFNEMSEQLENRLIEMNLSRSRLEAVLLSMFEGVLVLDPTGKILLINTSLRDFFHLASDVRGKSVAEAILHPEIQNIVSRALKSPRHLDACEISILSPEEKSLSVYAAPVIRDNQQEGAILVFHDTTNIRRLEKIRQDFVANVSHELKTPIASIKGFAETLLEGALEDKANARDFLKIIFTDASRLSRLVDDLLNLSKIESGKLNMSLKPIPIGPVINKVAASMKPQMENKSVTIEIRLPDPLSQIMADEPRLIQIFFNLIDNAIKYSKANGHIRITGLEEASHITITVSDDGIGIPKKDLPRLFERFYRVDKGRSRALGGTGLGLSIVKHIVKAHQGDIRVESRLGKGATFTLTLPKEKRTNGGFKVEAQHR